MILLQVKRTTRCGRARERMMLSCRRFREIWVGKNAREVQNRMIVAALEPFELQERQAALYASCNGVRTMHRRLSHVEGRWTA